MPTLRRIITLLTVIFASTLVLPPAAGAAGWKSLPYFDYSSNHLFVATDGTWTNAHVVRVPAVLHPFQPPAPFAQRGVRDEYIWAASCHVGSQFVSFHKTVMTPGAPYSGSFLLQYGRTGAGMTRPYRSAVLLVNGVVVGHLGKAQTAINAAPWREGLVPHSALRAFREGANDLSIRVQKTALPKGERRCTIPSAPGGRLRYISVNATLDLQFGSDLRALQSSKGKVQLVRNVQAGAARFITGSPSFQNNGPSTSLGGVITVTIGGYNYVELHSLTSSCTPDSGFGQLTCPYRNLAANTKISVSAVIRYQIPATFRSYDVQTITVHWSIQQTNFNAFPTSTTFNDHTIVLCGPLATDTCHP